MLFRNKEKQVLKLLKKNENEESQLMYYILNDLFQLQNDINNTKSLIDIKKAHIKYLIVTKNKLIKEKLGWAPSMPLREGLEITYAWIEKQVIKSKG